MEKIFIHLIPNCNHAVSLANFLASLNSDEEHKIYLDPTKFHSKDYYTETKEIFSNTTFLDKKAYFRKDAIVIFHGLFSKIALSLVGPMIRSSRKVAWAIWGGDTRLLSSEKNVQILNGLDFLLCAPGETAPHTDLLVPELYCCPYVPPLKPINHQEKQNLIVLGNSGDPSNNHQYLFDIVRDIEGFDFYVPFAYNGSSEYLKKLTGIAEKIGISERMYFQESMISLHDYHEVFARAKAYLSAHERQQSLGTMQIAYRSNCKVFLRKSISKDGNSKFLNPAFLTLQMLGYPNIEDIADLASAEGLSRFWAKGQNEINEINIRNPEYNNRIFDILKNK